MTEAHALDGRLLVADDDATARRVVAWYLKEQGYEVSVADAASLGRAGGEVPDLVILGVPDAGGAAATLGAAGRSSRWADVPVIVVTRTAAAAGAVSPRGTGEMVAASAIGELLVHVRAHLAARTPLADARSRAREAESALARAREEAESRGTIVDILREVTSELSPEEIYRVLARRVARALHISRCSVVLARPGEEVATVVTAFENPRVHNLAIRLSRYPEIRAALDHGVAVLIQDVSASPLYTEVRSLWAAEGIPIPIRSAIALPFRTDPQYVGVFFLRTTGDEPRLTRDDVDFAEAVVRASVAAIRRAQVLQTTMADKERFATLAITDSLTGALNRRALVERLTAEVTRARRYATSVSLLMIDLDHFKRVNDTHGHLVGDAVLREVTSLLHAGVRAVDVVARYGGEEFVVMLPETGADGAVAFADRLRDRIERYAFAAGSGASLGLTASVGVASFPEPAVDSADDLIARADEALYRAKAEGRNRVRR